MHFAHPIQKFQDWFTQQWIIIWGKKVSLTELPWLNGPIGEVGIIGDDFIKKLASDEGLIINRNSSSKGLIPSIGSLNLSKSETAKLAHQVIDFYENTSDYKLGFSVKWNPIFRVFGMLVNLFFSKRIHQLNIPTKNIKDSQEVISEIITLTDPTSHQVIYTVWFRTFKSNKQVIFSGVYSVCTLADGQKCVKASFPLPNGNATVIMSPSVGNNGELVLSSFGKKFGDPGFYFVLRDTKGNYWSRNHRSFKDKLVVSSNNKGVFAEHTQSLWNMNVLRFNYDIKPKK